MVELCDRYNGSHGCDLPLDHGGDVHVCEPDASEGKPIPYEGPTPSGGWSFRNSCFVWRRGDENEFRSSTSHRG